MLLYNVTLRQNDCIDEDFHHFHDMCKSVSKTCSFNETSSELEIKTFEPSVAHLDVKLQNLLNGQELHTEMLETLSNEIIHYKANLLSQNAQQTIQISELVAEVKVCEAKMAALETAEKKAEIHAALVKEVYVKLDAQQIETFMVKTEEMRRLLGIKLREIIELTDVVAKQSSEIIDTNHKINELQDKVDTLNKDCQF